MTLLNTMKGRYAFAAVFCALCLIETLCFTYFKLIPGIGKYNSLLYFIVGVCISALAVAFAFSKYSYTAIQVAEGKQRWLAKAIPVVALSIFLAILYIQFGQKLFVLWPINYRDADMLPLIKAGCERFLVGADVYAPVQEIWWGEQMPYLPAMWLPFVPAVWLGLDLRWTSLVLSLLAYLILFATLLRLRNTNYWIATVALGLAFFLQTRFYTWEQETYFGLSEEAAPAFFYIILMLAFMWRKYWLIGIVLALCTLSRYAILPFVPFFFLWLLVDKNYKGFVTALSAYIIVVLVVFVPFLIQRPEHFLNPPPGYVNGEKYFWPTELVNNRYNTKLGIAFFIGYEPSILQYARMFLVVATGTWSCIWVFLYYRYKQQLQKNKGLWLMIGLKVLLVLFYNFLNLPYDYLFIIPTIVSYPLIVAIISRISFDNIKTT